LTYPGDLYYGQEDTWALFSRSQAAVESALDYAMGEALQEAPLAMFDAMPLNEMADEYDLEVGARPAEFLEAMAQALEARTGEIEAGGLQGYPAALIQIAGDFDGTPYIGVLGVAIVDERVVAATALAQPDQWDAFGPTFMTMFNGLAFFQPEE
jgi:hypothetical protein